MHIDWLEQTEDDVPAHDEWLAKCEFLRMETLRVPKRRSDWRLGRWTAKHAVAAYLGLPFSDESLQKIEIRPDASGAPEVYIHDEPVALSISLSHSARLAMCALGPSEVALGCDIELIEARGPGFVSDYFTPEEQQMIAQAAAVDRDQLVTTLWSAKESALKATRCGLRVDTRSAAISFEDEWCTRFGLLAEHSPYSQASLCSLDRWSPLCAHIDRQQFYGWWRCADHLTRTVVSDVPIQAPACLAPSR